MAGVVVCLCWSFSLGLFSALTSCKCGQLPSGQMKTWTIALWHKIGLYMHIRVRLLLLLLLYKGLLLSPFIDYLVSEQVSTF